MPLRFNSLMEIDKIDKSVNTSVRLPQLNPCKMAEILKGIGHIFKLGKLRVACIKYVHIGG